MRKVESKKRPDDSALKRSLGSTYAAYQELLTLASSFSHEWKYYGSKHGWQLKITDRKKALLWLTPLENSFRVAFAVRETERESLLQSNLPSAAKEELMSARRYPEGYPLRITVSRETDFNAVRLVVRSLTSMRLPKQP
jgi:hypothetical protein